MNIIHWGIIGCGDVTEVKSGPAFNKVPNSALVAVMRRNGEKAADYAKRHNVPRWYDDASQLINDPGVNAIYIATPPDSHEAYTLAAIHAGKPVYVEKPMTLNYASAQRMANAAAEKNVKLVVAHYRRKWPLFKKIKELINEKMIGEPGLVYLQFCRPAMTKEELAVEKNAWRVNPAISGGGLFHDLAPHQLDIMFWLFGPATEINGRASNQNKVYAADDTVSGNIQFENGVDFKGNWNFNAAANKDRCEIIGSTGKLSFSFFSGNSIELVTNNQITRFDFDLLQHVQQPMIEKVVQYFRNEAGNPCTAEEGAEIMRWIGICSNCT
ncbi:MAG: Gfo/Idh/MocA family oxidoreductase [Chitinophagaceae bacterium]|nr:Gfo/Idh/MocA family oxidoreductase [Chitinophagaceae bacterium]